MAIPVIVFISVLVGLPGARLLALALRTRKAPEALLASFFLAGATGIFLRLLGVTGPTPLGSSATTITLLGHGILTAGLIAAVWFARSVFRPSVVWSFWLAAALSTLLLASCASLFMPGNTAEESAAVFAANGSRALPFIWLFTESLRQYFRMRRQAPLGLGDPVVTNRFLLWSVWTGLLTALPIVVIGFRIAARFSGDTLVETQQEMIGQIRLFLLLTAAGVAASVWLSFFPPKRYLAHITRRTLRSSPGEH
jgi:hypothetical protein